MARFLMILIMGGIISNGILSISQNNFIAQSTKTSVEVFSKDRARNIANSLAEMLLSKVRDSTTWRVNSYTQTDLFGGTANYKIIDTVIPPSDTLVKILVDANFNGFPANVVVFADKAYPGFIPPVVHGCWTANGPLNNTISDMYIDGRDHALNGSVIPGAGTFGVSSSTVFINTQKAYIGGTNNKIDYAPSYPENPNSIQQNYNWVGKFPNSPDGALGLAEGTLKAIAKSGLNGSQYATRASKLLFPLKGVTYLELATGIDEKIDIPTGGISKGILVIHNISTNSRVIETKTPTAQWFEGLIIGDYMFHLHCDILGSIILLSPNLETSKNCSGNKDHKILYSSESIKNATSIVGKSIFGNGYYGFLTQRMKVRFWYE